MKKEELAKTAGIVIAVLLLIAVAGCSQKTEEKNKVTEEKDTKNRNNTADNRTRKKSEEERSSEEEQNLEENRKKINKSKENNKSDEEENQDERTEGEVDERVKKVLDTYYEKVESFSYLKNYGDIYGEVYYKNREAKIIPENPFKIEEGYAGTNYMDIYFVSFKEKRVRAYCNKLNLEEDDEESVCDNQAVTNVTLNYEEYKFKLPIDFLKELAGEELKGVTPGGSINNRQTTKLTFKTSRGEESIWIDNFYNIPLKYRKKYGGVSRVVVFDRIAINSVEKDYMEEKRR